MTTTPRGLRNNNPGNLRDAGIPWRGLTGADDDGFCVFDTPESGLRAIAMDLSHDLLKKGKRTVEALISEYAPPSENNTKAYIEMAARALGVGPRDTLTLGAPMLRAIIPAIVKMENGRNPYTVDQIEGALQSALAYRKVSA